jgi:hypothetical protein
MNKLIYFYKSIILEIFCRKNDKNFLQLPFPFFKLLLICGCIGLLRNDLEIIFKIPFFYSFSPDIVFTMFVWPIHLFLFPAMLLHFLLKKMKYDKLPIESIYSLFFSLQIIHLIIPPLDRFGYYIGIPYWYTFGDHVNTTDWSANLLLMTPGIIAAWIISIYAVVKVLRKYISVCWKDISVIVFVIMTIIFIPTYVVWPTLNTIFNHVFGLWASSFDPRVKILPVTIFWGYGTYFALTALMGGFYYKFSEAKNNLVSSLS